MTDIHSSYATLVNAVNKDLEFDDHGIVVSNGGEQGALARQQLLDSMVLRIRFVDQTEEVYQTYTLGVKFELENSPTGRLAPVPKPAVILDLKYKVIDMNLIPVPILAHYIALRTNLEQWMLGNIKTFAQAIPPGFEQFEVSDVTAIRTTES